MLGSALYGRIGLRHGDTLHGLDMPSNGYMSPFMPRRLFGLTFAASGALLLLVLLEVYGGVPPSNRWLLWRLHLIFGLALIVLVLPYMLLVLILRRLLPISEFIVRFGVGVGLSVWLYFFQKVGEPFPVSTSDILVGSLSDVGTSALSTVLMALRTLPSLCLSRAGIIGVCLSAIMSGIGAVHGLAASIRRFSLGQTTPEDLEMAQKQLVLAIQRLAKHRTRVTSIRRRLEAARHTERQRQEGVREECEDRRGEAWRAAQAHDWRGVGMAIGAVAAASLLESARTFVSSSPQSATLLELRDLKSEGAQLTAALRREMTEYSIVLDNIKLGEAAQSLRGRSMNIIGDIFSCYCVLKVCMSTRSVLRQRSEQALGLPTSRRCCHGTCAAWHPPALRLPPRRRCLPASSHGDLRTLECDPRSAWYPTRLHRPRDSSRRDRAVALSRAAGGSGPLEPGRLPSVDGGDDLLLGASCGSRTHGPSHGGAAPGGFHGLPWASMGFHSSRSLSRRRSARFARRGLSRGAHGGFHGLPWASRPIPTTSRPQASEGWVTPVFRQVRGFLVQASRVALRIEHLHFRRTRQRHERNLAKGARPVSSVEHVPLGESSSAVTGGKDLTDASATPLPPPSPLGGVTPHMACGRSAGAMAETSALSTELADLVGCVIAELMGFYLLSSVLMMRGSLPLEFRAGISEAAGDLEFDFYHHFNDAIFLASFVIAAVTVITAHHLAARSSAAVSRSSSGPMASAVADQRAGVRRHHHAVQGVAERQRAEAAVDQGHANASARTATRAAGLTDVVAEHAAVAAQVVAEAARAAKRGPEALLELAAFSLMDDHDAPLKLSPR